MIPSGTAVERRAWAHRHPVAVVAVWTLLLGSSFLPFVASAGWPLVALAYALAFATGLGFLRSTERLYRMDQQQSHQND